MAKPPPNTPEYTKAEALAFIEAMRLAVSGRVGFKWMVEKLSSLASYIESMAEENEQLNGYIDLTDARQDFEAYQRARFAGEGATPPPAEGRQVG